MNTNNWEGGRRIDMENVHVDDELTSVIGPFYIALDAAWSASAPLPCDCPLCRERQPHRMNFPREST